MYIKKICTFDNYNKTSSFQKTFLMFEEYEKCNMSRAKPMFDLKVVKQVLIGHTVVALVFNSIYKAKHEEVLVVFR